MFCFEGLELNSGLNVQGLRFRVSGVGFRF